MKQNELIEETHYYFNEEGNLVFTRQYHLEKGICCGLGCLHCPYNYEKAPKTGQSETLNSTESRKNY